MTWTPLPFGKHKGKTLPQVLFEDPDGFFWAMKYGAFRHGTRAKAEAQYI